jgi:FixJ family two-component response regulator
MGSLWDDGDVQGRGGRAGVRVITGRQAEVLGAVGERLTNAEIATRLGVSERTVESHVSAPCDVRRTDRAAATPPRTQDAPALPARRATPSASAALSRQAEPTGS